MPGPEIPDELAHALLPRRESAGHCHCPRSVRELLFGILRRTTVPVKHPAARAYLAPATAPLRSFMSRDLRRAALFRCMTPLETARSSWLIARLTASSVVGSLASSAIASRACRIWVRTELRIGRLRRRRFSATRLLLMACFVLAQ